MVLKIIGLYLFITMLCGVFLVVYVHVYRLKRKRYTTEIQTIKREQQAEAKDRSSSELEHMEAPPEESSSGGQKTAFPANLPFESDEQPFAG